MKFLLTILLATLPFLWYDNEVKLENGGNLSFCKIQVKNYRFPNRLTLKKEIFYERNYQQWEVSSNVFWLCF